MRKLAYLALAVPFVMFGSFNTDIPDLEDFRPHVAPILVSAEGSLDEMVTTSHKTPPEPGLGQYVITVDGHEMKLPIVPTAQGAHVVMPAAMADQLLDVFFAHYDAANGTRLKVGKKVVMNEIDKR
jgi:hypothetical protein